MPSAVPASREWLQNTAETVARARLRRMGKSAKDIGPFSKAPTKLHWSKWNVRERREHPAEFEAAKKAQRNKPARCWTTEERRADPEGWALAKRRRDMGTLNALGPILEHIAEQPPGWGRPDILVNGPVRGGVDELGSDVHWRRYR